MARNGFTLLELLVALLIAASAVALVSPQFSRLQTLIALKSGARELAAALRATRTEAIARSRDAALVLDVRQKTYQGEGSTRSRSLAAALEVRLLAAHTEAAQEGRGAIRFFPDGSSTGGRVTLAAAGERYVVDVDWLTGRVEIHE